MKVIDSKKSSPAAAAEKVVKYALINYHRNFDPIYGDDVDVWLWEAQDAVNHMNRVDREYKYKYENQVLWKEPR